ncbi:hypothetical protein IPH19_01235 [Candidatus Uhrbacteria bacterium]|nr:MAG: hypothetical protein IPH19_01235 [Candidatus Uhrbacteria bacterium]
MFDEYTARTKALRIPVVASYAYELVNQIIPLKGLPLSVHTESVGGSGDRTDSARYQVNRAHLNFHDIRVVAEVRSWEPKTWEGNKRRKTLQGLKIEFKKPGNEADGLLARLQAKFPLTVIIKSETSPGARQVIELDLQWMVANSPELIIAS